jgi:hypothetical protein
MNRKYQSFIASLVLLVLFGVMTGCRETPINNNPVPRGSQFVGEINGVVRDGNTGAPLSGVTLRLIGPDGDLSTTTNADGIYVFRNLQAGTYKIAAAAPAGYAPTRTRDVVLSQEPNQSTGVAVVRVARDFRFFTANAAFAATLQYQTPDGRLLPVPAGTPVFINFVKQVNPATGLEETVGDVQVALVRDSVRANGAVSITGLPAVGALSQAGPAETPRFIVPLFTVGGVSYGDPTTAKALNYPIAGLRPGTTFTLPPTVGIIRSSGGTAGLSLLATNMNSRTNFGTTDTIFVAFNKPINTFRFFLFRTQTPYIGFVPISPTSPIASTDDGSLIATVLPAGAVPQLGGLIVGANQAFAIRLNRPFITGSDHRLDINAIAEDNDSLNAFGPSFARTFTTVPGIRLLSVTAGGVTLSPTGLASAVNVDSIIFRFDLPPGRQLVGPYFTRGPRRNVRFASSSTTPGGGTDEVGRAGVPGEANRIDCVGVINGANLSFGYRTVVGTDYQIHTMLVDPGVEQPVVSDPNVAPGTPGNFRSNLPGDFGVGVLNNLSSVYSSFRIFRAAVNQAIVPRIVSVSLPANPSDSIRITFSRPMRRSTSATTGLAVGDTFGTPGSVIRFFRTATDQPYGPAANFPTGSTNPIQIRVSSISSSGDTTTYFLVRDQKRALDDAPIPFEGNTSYTLQILGSLAAVPAAGGRELGELAGASFPFTRSARTAGQRLVSVTVSGVRVFPTPPSPLPIPDSGTIVLRFAQPIRQDVEYRTRGVGQNFELERTSPALGQILFPPTKVDLGPDNTTIFIDPVGVKGDCTITFNYRGLYRNATYALRLVGDGNSNAPTNFFDPPNAQAVPDSIRNVRWAAFPNDPGVGVSGNYNANTGNRLNVEFTVTATPPRLIAASTDTNSTAYPLVSSANPLLANSIRLYFDREMDRGGTFSLTRVASPYDGLTGTTLSLRPTWSADGKVVSLVPQAGMRGLTDTSRTLEAGTTYQLNISGLFDVNGTPFSPPVNNIIFNTQPGIRLVGVTVGGQTFTSPNQPIKADSVGTIKLIFNQNIAGSYNVRGSLGNNGPGRFIMVEDSLANANNPNFDLARTNALAGNGTVNSVLGNMAQAAFVDSIATVSNNEITINYRVSAQRLTGRLPGSFPNPPASYPPRTIRFSIDSVSFVASPNGGTTASDSLYYNIQVTPRPRTIRGPVRGDLGVSGFQVGFFPVTQDIYINNKTPFNRFGPGNTGLTRFAFYFSTEGVPAAQSFPDLVISSVRNAAESVSQAAKQTVSTVRGWWKRFRGE